MTEPSASNYAAGAALDDNTSLLGNPINLKTLTLDAGIDNATATISVSESITGINLPCYLRIGSEIIHAASSSGGDFITCTRGADGSTAAAHILGDSVYVVYAANHFNQLKKAIIAIQTVLGLVPQGGSATVRARLDALAAASGGTDILQVQVFS